MSDLPGAPTQGPDAERVSRIFAALAARDARARLWTFTHTAQSFTRDEVRTHVVAATTARAAYAEVLRGVGLEENGVYEMRPLRPESQMRALVANDMPMPPRATYRGEVPDPGYITVRSTAAQWAQMAIDSGVFGRQEALIIQGLHPDPDPHEFFAWTDHDWPLVHPPAQEDAQDAADAEAADPPAATPAAIQPA